jgi:ABA sandwich protein
VTDEEIDMMEAGDQINFLICEKIFENKLPLLCFSTNLDNAWLVLRKMVSEDWDVQMSISSKTPDGDAEQCYCHFQHGDDNAQWREDWKFIQAWAPTIPLAICRAALLAKNEGKP